jgi:hypothetical protein
MNKKRALKLNFMCPSCHQTLDKIGREYGCVNEDCFQNYHQVAYSVLLGLLPKNRL